MKLRIFAIMILLFPMLGLAGDFFVPAGSDCTEPARSMAVEENGCCDDVQVEPGCSMSDSVDCHCALDAPQVPFKAPVTPMPLTLGDLILGVPKPQEQTILSIVQDGDHWLLMDYHPEQVQSPKNTIQSILGIWRI
jgi:hypothetical protein